MLQVSSQSNMDPLRNPKDPLNRSGPEAEKTLFKEMVSVANGYPLDVVSGAAINILVNAVRQMNSTQKEALVSFDELVSKAKTLLLDQHYDNLGNRKNIFPFHQTIEVPHFIEKNRVYN